MALDLCAVLGLEVGFRDPGVGEFGLHNAVLPVGDTFLEVVSPQREGTTAGRLLERRGGDGGYMVIFQTDDLAAQRRRVLGQKVRIVWEIALEDAKTIHLHPRDVGAAIVSFDEMAPPPSWRWAGPDWEKRMHSDVVERIVGVELQAADPAGVATKWAELLAQTAEWDGQSGYEITLPGDGAKVRFAPATDGRGDGVRGVLLRAADGDRALEAARERGLGVDGDVVVMGGVRFRLV